MPRRELVSAVVRTTEIGVAVATLRHTSDSGRGSKEALCHYDVMAKTVIVRLTDDIDGGDADETVYFSLDGTSYEIDLSTANAARLREAIRPFVEMGRVSGATGRSRPTRSATGREDPLLAASGRREGPAEGLGQHADRQAYQRRPGQELDRSRATLKPTAAASPSQPQAPPWRSAADSAPFSEPGHDHPSPPRTKSPRRRRSRTVGPAVPV